MHYEKSNVVLLQLVNVSGRETVPLKVIESCMMRPRICGRIYEGAFLAGSLSQRKK